jgi:hypothetical protein
LKTFLTQIGPTLPLTLDPPIICFWKWIGWKDYEVQKRNLESVSAKNYNLFSPCACIPPYPPTLHDECPGFNLSLCFIPITDTASQLSLAALAKRGLLRLALPRGCWAYSVPTLDLSSKFTVMAMAWGRTWRRSRWP